MRAAALALALALLPERPFADDPAARGFDADPFRLAPLIDSNFGVPTASVPFERSYSAALVVDYLHGLIPWKEGTAPVGYVVPDRLTLHFLGSYSFGLVEVGAALPVVGYQSSNLSPLTSLGVGGALAAPVAAVALGDLRIVGKLPLLNAGPRSLLRLPVPLQASLVADLELPTGSGQAFASNGFVATPSAVLTALAGGVRLDAQLGYSYRAQTGQYLNLVVPGCFDWGLGAAVPLPPALGFDAWKAVAEVTGEVPDGDNGSARYSLPLDVRAGVRATLGPELSAEVGLGSGFGGAYGREVFRAFVAVRFGHVNGDRDGDGVPDDRDLCPNDPGPEALQGCPDRDGDGIPDILDRCPDEKGPRELEGCPDRDGDGVPDYRDRCPDEKGPRELEGCPDTDGDGVPDIDDKCPLEPGPAQNDGCPVGDEPVVEIQAERLSLRDMIQFDFGRDTIKPESGHILDDIAAVLRDHPELTLIRVEGHTDIVGSAEYNQSLSERRARAVVRALVARSVAQSRLVAAGYGFTRPIASNATALGRAKNRRVEFVIVSESQERK